MVVRTIQSADIFVKCASNYIYEVNIKYVSKKSEFCGGIEK